MHTRMRTYISACFYYSGLVSLSRWWMQRRGRYLIILYYHRAGGGDLRSHLLYLRRHYRILHLEDALQELYLISKGKVQRKDRRPLLALTFDDGYYDNYTYAFPLACELQIPMTIFLIPGYIGNGNLFWWISHLIRFAGIDNATIEGRTYHLDQAEERKALAQIINTHVGQTNSITEQREFLTSICKLLSVPPSVISTEEPAPLLEWEQVREMEESGWISFGAHTTHHPDLACMTDYTEVQDEVGGSRMILEQRLGHIIHAFAYPYGRSGVNGQRAVQEAGYNWAVTILPGFNTSRSNPYLLHRRSLDVNQHWLIVAAETAGLWFFFSHLKRIVTHCKRKASIICHHFIGATYA